MTILLWSLYALFAILQVLDIITTLQALKAQNTREANPLMREIMAAVGVTEALIGLKILTLSIMAAASVFYPCTILVWLLAGLNIFYSWIVWNNYKLTEV